MQNNNYKDRLRNHQETFNPEAWTQMEHLLDAVEPKKKKRGWIWFFGLALGLLLLSIVGIQSLRNTTSAPQTSMNNTHMEKSKSAIGQESNPDKDITDNSVNNSKVDEKNITSDQTDPSQSKSTPSSFTQSTVTNTESTKNEIAEYDTQKETNILTVNPANNSNLRDETTLTEQLDLQNNSNGIDDEINNEVEDANTMESVEKSDQKTQKEIYNLAQLNLSKYYINSGSNNRLLPERVELPKPNRVWYGVSAGYAVINDLNGFIVGVDGLYELDRIIHLSSQASFTYASQKTQTGIQEMERQIDLSFYVHLNIINSRRHRLSFDPGIGFTIYNKRFEAFVDGGSTQGVKNNTGRNLQGRFNYRYLLKRGTSIGFKIGAISFDDSTVYGSFQLLKQF